MIITIDTAAPLSDRDAAVLQAVLGENLAPAPSDADLNDLKKQLASVEKDVKAEEEKPAPRRRAAAKKAPEPVAEEAPEEPVDETPEAVEEDTPAVLEQVAVTAEEAPTLADAVAVASPLISAGKGAQVKKVLTEHGANRVKELDADKIGSFIDALKKLNEEA